MIENIYHLTLRLLIPSSFEWWTSLSMTYSSSAGVFLFLWVPPFLHARFGIHFFILKHFFPYQLCSRLCLHYSVPWHFHLPFAYLYYCSRILHRHHPERIFGGWSQPMLFVMRSVKNVFRTSTNSVGSMVSFEDQILFSKSYVYFFWAFAIPLPASIINFSSYRCHMWRYCIAVMAWKSCAVGLLARG